MMWYRPCLLCLVLLAMLLTPTWSGDASSSRPKKFLLLQSDTRNLESNVETARYHSLTAVINFIYTKLHSADYLYFVFNQSRAEFLSDANVMFRAEFRNSSLQQSTEISGTYEKKGPSCYHPVLRQFRAAPWTKLLALWNVSQSNLASRYSHILFLDSDAVVNPKFHHQSLFDKLHGWSTLRCHSSRAHKNDMIRPDQSAAIFLDNSPFVPYQGHLCDGAFVLNLGFEGVAYEPYAAATSRSDEKGASFIANFLKEWWDNDVESKDFNHWWHHDATNKNFNHAYEQDSLWNQLYNPRTSWRINANTVCVVPEPQFPPSKNESLWVLHVGSPWEIDRLTILRTLVDQMRLSSDDFAKMIEYISRFASVSGSAAEIGQKMSECA